LLDAIADIIDPIAYNISNRVNLFEVRASQQSLLLCANSKEDMEEWIKLIMMNVQWLGALKKQERTIINEKAQLTSVRGDVKRGHLFMFSTIHHIYRKCWMVLHEDKLHKFQSRTDLRPDLVIALRGCSLASTGETTSKPTFEIYAPSGKVYAFLAKTTAILHEWMEVIVPIVRKFFREFTSASDCSAGTFLSATSTPGSSNASPLVIPAFQLDNVSKKGFLFKRGELNKAWKRRWFVLQGENLYYFVSTSDTIPVGSINILLCKIVDRKDPSSKDLKKFYFDIITPSRTYYIYAESIDIVEEWKSAINASRLQILHRQR